MDLEKITQAILEGINKLIENQEVTNRLLVKINDINMEGTRTAIGNQDSIVGILSSLQETQKEQLEKFQTLSFLTPPKAETGVN